MTDQKAREPINPALFVREAEAGIKFQKIAGKLNFVSFFSWGWSILNIHTCNEIRAVCCG